MRARRYHLLLGLVAAMVMSSVTWAPPSGAVTPPRFGRSASWPWDAPDPTILRVGSDYFAYTTNTGVCGGSRRLNLLTSPDLSTWTQQPEAAGTWGSWVRRGCGTAWAPAVAVIGTTVHLWYTEQYIDPVRGPLQCIGHATAPSPYGPFDDPSDQPVVCPADQWGAIDPDVSRSSDGRWWLAWKNDGNRGGQPTGLWVAELLDGGDRLGPTSQLLSSVGGPAWELGVIEAPTLLHLADRTVLAYSAGNAFTGWYGVGLARCAGPRGPCTRTTSPWAARTPWAVGTGGQSVVADALGRRWLAYHGWDPGLPPFYPDGRRQLFVERIDVVGDLLVADNRVATEEVGRPAGTIDGLTVGPTGRLVARGWAADPDAGTTATTVRLRAGSTAAAPLLATRSADRPRPDVGAAFPELGGDHGWELTAEQPLPGGTHTVCLTATDLAPVTAAPGSEVTVACRTVAVDPAPVGNLEVVRRATPTSLEVGGWASGPDAPGATEIHVYVDGRWGGAARTDTFRPDVDAAYPAQGGPSGFRLTVPEVDAPVTTRDVTVCAYAISARPGVRNPLLGCGVIGDRHRPTGALDELGRGTDGRLTARGWALDPDTSTATAVHLYADGAWLGAITTGEDRPDVAAVFPWFGQSRGWRLTGPVRAGATVCAYGINTGPGTTNPLLGCRVAP